MKFFLFILLLAMPVIAQPIIPDSHLTPGAIMPGVTVEQLCQRGYANVVNGGARHVTEAQKKAVFIAYFGKVPANPGAYEIDHLISLELGGSNDNGNLWPETYLGMWNARVKDRLEDWMAAQLRRTRKSSGHDVAAATLARFQAELAANWTNAYIHHLGQPTVSVKHGRATE